MKESTSWAPNDARTCSYVTSENAPTITCFSFILSEKSFSDVISDRICRAAFERFLEILSEASRHIPKEMKDDAPEIPWADIANIGNHLRHAYHRVDFELLWRIHEDGELMELRAATQQFLAKISK
ncbi:MAG: HepT-like ribonuclease domain-containing protein [Notoacmeibacter sp.]